MTFVIEDDGNAERRRLAEADSGERPWRGWGPYLSERAWGTVREDYSAHGTAWDYFPHDQARSRTYRWNEDGMAGICDDRQTFCFALALWNGKDPILKERMFGLGGDLGNHGEDVKDYWWYVDSTPTHSWMKWRYHYPQQAFPYDDLVAENCRRGRDEPEYELVDTGIFDEDRYWAVEVDYAKAGPTDMCMRITIKNMGPEPATLHLLPTLWFRNTWAWGLPGRDYMPEIRAKDNGLPSPATARPGRCSATTTPTATGSGASRVASFRRTASTTTSCTARTRSTLISSVPKPPCTTSSPCPPAAPTRSGCG
jgi:hypothetical protein